MTMKNRVLWIMTFAALISVMGCSGGASTPSEPAPQMAATKAVVVEDIVAKIPPQMVSIGDPVSQGHDIFVGTGGCGACHKIEGISSAVGMLGPELTHIGTDASARKPGMSAKEYLYESIREPQAFVAEGVERSVPNIMTAAITAGLTDAEVDALVEFLSVQE